MNTRDMRDRLVAAGFQFSKQPATETWRCYDLDSFTTVAEHREYGKCVHAAAEALGEEWITWESV